MCRNGNEIQRNNENRQEINRISVNNMEPVNLQQNQQNQQNQRERRMFMDDMKVIDLPGLNVQKKSGIPSIQQHVNVLKEEKRILQESRDEYSPYNVQGQFLKYVNPRLQKRNPIEQVTGLCSLFQYGM